ncbi:hypothetical protein Acr_00g0042380 [Actinidia rufa]|uniref:DUF1990 domain-containing protein n=1 Tax=Actinidia rufa TaxID=165716 RepID=A0A7J0DIQ1_9ERIC|nr:hypothetical protein Acr_00g0042380 [Actinidia rufa]
MIFLCWTRPSPKEQKDCIMKSGDFNYDSKHRGASAKPASSLQVDKELSKNGFLLNHARVLVGSGLKTYEKGKNSSSNLEVHFGLDWAFVDPKTPIQSGAKFCVCVKEFFPWLMMPLQVVYVNENKNAKKAVASFGFGSGTLQGHLLGGEERFSIELDENNQVWNAVRPAVAISDPYFLARVELLYLDQSRRTRQKSTLPLWTLDELLKLTEDKDEDWDRAEIGIQLVMSRLEDESPRTLGKGLQSFGEERGRRCLLNGGREGRAWQLPGSFLKEDQIRHFNAGGDLFEMDLTYREDYVEWYATVSTGPILPPHMRIGPNYALGYILMRHQDGVSCPLSPNGSISAPAVLFKAWGTSKEPTPVSCLT